ncbi:MAG: hypothetical protein JWR74_3207 [Polaromonas sp.]|nr:hypothetical protein [Polaromonas sp.]
MSTLIRSGIRRKPSVLGQFIAAASPLVAELPWPPAELNPNRKNGKHWSSTHAIKTRYLSDCRLLVVQAMQAAGYVPPAGVLALTITFAAPDKRRRDVDNLLASLKSGLDGVSQALGVDDQHFEPITLRRAIGGKPGKVVIEVTA